jgi:WS/DGAT/MGAT family acyltransferase
MKQLGILDSAFVNLEQPNTPQHVGGMGIYDPSTAPGGFVRFKQVIANFEQRLQRMPLFRTRLVEVPGGIDRPYWAKDANFDVEFHLRHIALPHPGDWRQLCIQVARLHARPLDLSRPLWECYIIEGLDNIPDLPEGSFAVYTKMHHALVDGAGGTAFMEALHDLEPEPAPREPEADEPRLVDREPSNAELLGRAAVNQVRNTAGVARGAIDLTREMGKFAYRIMRKEIPLPDVRAPRTRFNNPVGPHRIFTATCFPIADILAIKQATGVTLNDVALGIVGGALTRYLDDKGETPEESLAAALPVNLRSRRGETGENNNVGSIFASLHTDIDNPLERLKAIHNSTSEAKEFGQASPMLDTIKVAGIFSPAITRPLASVWSHRNLSKYIPVNISTVISNVPGPRFDLYCAGARMVQYQGLGLLTPGVGLFHVVFSQSETLNLSVLGDRDSLPDPDHYMECLRASYDELKSAAAGLQGGRSTRSRPATKKKPATKRAKAPRKKTTTGKAPTAKRKPAAKKSKTGARATAAPKVAAKSTAESKPVRVAASSPASDRPKARRRTGASTPKLKVVSG